MKILLSKAIKREVCLSQEELASRAGLHRTYVSDLERGARNPSIESVEKLAAALELSLPMLFETAGHGRAQAEILLVEDNPRDVELTVRAFQKARVTNPIHVAHDGAEALEFLFATGRYADREDCPPRRSFCLTWTSPKKSGVEVLRQIKGSARTKAIQVIVLTVSTRGSDLAECRRLGVKAYLIKPVAFQKFSEATSDLNLAWTLGKSASAVMAK